MLLICQQKSAEQEPENIFEVVWIEDKKGLQQQKKKIKIPFTTLNLQKYITGIDDCYFFYL